MHALVFALATLVTVLPASQLDTILERGEILVGTTGDYRPFSYRRPDGTLEGFDIDAARRLGAALGVEVRFVATSWPTLVAGLREGRYNIAMSGITRTLERQTRVSLSDPYFSIGKCPLVRAADRERYADLEAIDRPGVRLGVNPGGTNEAFVREHIENAEIVVIEDNLSIPEAVASGRVDVMLTDNVEAVVVAALDPRLVAVSPDSPLTHEELSYMWVNLWLHQMTLGRELEHLREKWMTAAASPGGLRDRSAPFATSGAGQRLTAAASCTRRPGAQVGDSLVVQLDHQLSAAHKAFDLGSRQILAQQLRERGLVQRAQLFEHVPIDPLQVIRRAESLPGAKRARVVNHPDVPIGSDDEIAAVPVGVVDKLIEHTACVHLGSPRARVGRSQLLLSAVPLGHDDVVDPPRQGGGTRADLAFHRHRHHLQIQVLVQQVRGDVVLVAVPEVEFGAVDGFELAFEDVHILDLRLVRHRAVGHCRVLGLGDADRGDFRFQDLGRSEKHFLLRSSQGDRARGILRERAASDGKDGTTDDHDQRDNPATHTSSSSVSA